ncbi:biotin--[acetyl-CoA-carboxylase] ligase [Bacteroidales bacterium OttesenSCG-928-B11]|nr:biotin--[acetyl-CoA-carboxylase] ligase [Bacteroidales bacterium OttesenSCG-928-E04]MDL2312906.1 biotin--[acetyl-CoA-carboxylase] ligase [Bacteroidales bacterium OttesenSCG-928-B11]MDL2326390.1 biotin--[acetyl-CoA-carboxylase] ligase [Bacteroidales bacterium OttesenSCG-928-A14]
MNNERFIFIPEVTSTNDYLNFFIRERKSKGFNTQEFTIVHTDRQTAGRGQQGNTWESNPKENILASFYLNPSISPRKQFYINIFFALSVRKMISKYVYSAKIKWPNDIYIDQKKIAGILVEHNIQGSMISQTIAGVGINLNQTSFSKLLPNPTSIKLESGHENGRITLLKELDTIARTYYELLNNEQYEQLLKEYYWHLFRMNETHGFIVHGEEVEAKVIGLDEYGQLLLMEKDGKKHVCGFKEVQWIL